VTCEQFIHALSQAVERENDRADVGLSKHASGCPDCAAVWQVELLLRGAPPVERSLELPRALQRTLHESAPRRPLGPRLRLFAPLAACAAGLALMAALAPRADLSHVFEGEVLGPVLLLLSLFVGLLGLFRFRGATGLGAPAWLRWLAVVLGIGLFHLLAAAQALPDPHPPLPPRDCLLLGLCAGALVGGVALGFARRSVLTGASAAGALLGCSAGYAALAMLHLHCPSRWALHLHVAHGLPLLLLVITGALWGRRWLTV
jgi:Negative regulator of sigma F